MACRRSSVRKFPNRDWEVDLPGWFRVKPSLCLETQGHTRPMKSWGRRGWDATWLLIDSMTLTRRYFPGHLGFQSLLIQEPSAAVMHGTHTGFCRWGWMQKKAPAGP